MGDYRNQSREDQQSTKRWYDNLEKRKKNYIDRKSLTNIIKSVKGYNVINFVRC